MEISIQILTIERCFDIICASETKLDNTIDNSKENIKEYSLYRKDRNRQGGGEAIYVSQNIPLVRNTDLDIDGIEIIWVELTVGSCCFLVGACYRPPGMSSIEVDNFIDLLKINIETIPSDPYKGIALLGDFNDRCQTWNDNHGKSELKRQLVDLIYSSNFEQIISLPTRCENILDLCITKMPRYILDSGVDVPPDPDLDHSLIWVIFFFGVHQNPNRSTREICTHDNGDYVGLNNVFLSLSWEYALEGLDNVNDMVKNTTDIIVSTAKNVIPHNPFQ